MENSVVRSGNLRGYLPHLLMHVGTQKTSPYEVFRELVSNSLTWGGANYIIVYLDQRQYIVSDNGEGMVDQMMNDADRKLGDAFFANPLKISKDELKKNMLYPSWHSLEWVVGYIGLSKADVFELKNKEGLKATGLMSFQSVANQCVMTSKARLDLAKMRWGTDFNDQDKVETYALLLPKADEIPLGNLHWDIVNYSMQKKPLADPWGKPKQHGTTIYLSEPREGLEKSIDPQQLADYLGRQFQPYLEKGVCIEVIDHLTQKSKMHQGGIPIKAQRPVYKVPPVIDRDLKTKDGGVFHAKIYFDPANKKDSIVLRCFNVVDIARLPKFQHAPWLNDGFFGEITFPRYPARREQKIWGDLKEVPQQSPERIYWENTALTLEEEMLQHRTATQQRVLDKLVVRAQEALSNAVNLAVRDLDLGEHEVLVAAAKERSSHSGSNKRESTRTPINQRFIRVSVMDEHPVGLPGYEFLLYRLSDNKLIDKIKSGIGGHARFSSVENGRYKVQIIIPPGVKLLGPKDDITGSVKDYEELLISDSAQNKLVIFHVITGERPHETVKLSQVRMRACFEVLPNPEELWRPRFSEHVFEYVINVTGIHLGPAMERKDFETVANLVPQYAASCICIEYMRPEKQKHPGTEEEKLTYFLLYKDALTYVIGQHFRREFASELKRLAAKAR